MYSDWCMYLYRIYLQYIFLYKTHMIHYTMKQNYTALINSQVLKVTNMA
jgi:hypothetical protein